MDEEENGAPDATGSGDSAGPRTGARDDSAAQPAPGLSEPEGIWQNPAYRFAILFVVYLVVIAVVYPRLRNANPDVADALAEHTAQIVYTMFSPFSPEITHSEQLVRYGKFPVRIIEECTGVYEVLIYWAAVLAFPTTWRKIGTGLLMGTPLLYLFNILRIGMLLVIGHHWRPVFRFMHLYFWQATLILMIASVWFLWIAKVVRPRDEKVSTSSP